MLNNFIDQEKHKRVRANTEHPGSNVFKIKWINWLINLK
jgi:hypothetical protein